MTTRSEEVVVESMSTLGKHKQVLSLKEQQRINNSVLKSDRVAACCTTQPGGGGESPWRR